MLLSGEISPIGNSKVYAFSGIASEVIAVTVARLAGAGDPCVRIVDPEGGFGNYTCIVAGGQTAVTLDVRLTRSGTHTLQVSDGGFNQTFAYAVMLERLSPRSPTATPIGSGQTLDGDISPIGYTRIYSFQGATGDSVTITVARRSGLGDPCVRLIDPEGVVGTYTCIVSGGQSTIAIDTKLTKSGTHTFQVVDGGHNQTFVYRVDLQCFGACPAQSPPAPATCIYQLSPASQAFSSSAATGSVGVLTGRGCVWTASIDAAHVTLTSGVSGTGPGTVRYSLTANTAAASRTATLRVADQAATIAQSGTSPLFW